MLEEFLPLVNKPARYINSEINSVHKDLTKVKSKFCLFFPDTYEIGMSHLGLRILYHILNSRKDTVCERVFSPWTDYEQRLRISGRPLTSLESNLPLAQFDIIGITLQYELSYTNILVGLELAGIPLRAKDRNDSHPIIIAGGPCALNPEPLSDFMDAFFIGDAEEAIHEVVELRQKIKYRKNFLKDLSRLDGFYVPAFSSGSVNRRIVRNLDGAVFPANPILPLMKPVHDRVTVEVARGCIHGCRFCQAGIIYRPYRERSPERIKALLQESLSCTGYDELSLASLSSGDYSNIKSLMLELAGKYKEHNISISLPSLRVGTLTPEMIHAIADTRKTGFTLAPEAGTERLRKVINKPIKDKDLLDCAQNIFSSGWNVLKLYFMIGLPTETKEDLDGITRLTNDLFALGKRTSKRPVQLNVSISTFVPKPHTAFQWTAQATLDEIREKQEYIEKKLKVRGITIKTSSSEASLLEGIFSRGDRALGSIMEEAVRCGCRFDGWAESLNFKKWISAFQKQGFDILQYASRTFSKDEQLPWGYIQSGVTTEFLRKEYDRALTETATVDCRTGCSDCGIGCTEGIICLGKPGASKHEQKQISENLSRSIVHSKIPKHSNTIRLKYSKIGRIRFLSHLDLMTTFQRALMRSQIPILFHHGFNPHPKISFGPALAVGMESDAEYLDMEIEVFDDHQKIVSILNNTMPEGIRILESRIISSKAPSLSSSICRYVYEVNIPSQFTQDIETRIQTFLAQSSIMVEKSGKWKDIKPAIESITVATSSFSKLEVVLHDQHGTSARIHDIIEKLFGISPGESASFAIKRTAMFVNKYGTAVNPMDI